MTEDGGDGGSEEAQDEESGTEMGDGGFEEGEQYEGSAYPGKNAQGTKVGAVFHATAITWGTVLDAQGKDVDTFLARVTAVYSPRRSPNQNAQLVEKPWAFSAVTALVAPPPSASCVRYPRAPGFAIPGSEPSGTLYRSSLYNPRLSPRDVRANLALKFQVPRFTFRLAFACPPVDCFVPQAIKEPVSQVHHSSHDFQPNPARLGSGVLRPRIAEHGPTVRANDPACREPFTLHMLSWVRVCEVQ